jgi:hypothetical protein
MKIDLFLLFSSKQYFIMKRFYILLLSALGLGLNSDAAEGDTTIVTAHNQTQLSWYQAYDDAIAFPDGTTSYRKIVMEFTLGKYACPGYNPNNPGGGQGQTGWCADWDYDVHLIACNATGDTIELGRLITPYANSNFPRTPATWSHPYAFDVTDYYPLLKGDMTFRIFYAGWSGGFTGSVKFYFIEGTPPRNVVGIVPLWKGGYNYGHGTENVNTEINNKNVTIPADAKEAEMKVIITGHGGGDNQNCAEFCKKWYTVKYNDAVIEQKDIWRDNCGSNFLYPQSGTWVFNRSNWCPGDLVHTIVHKIPGAIVPGASFDVDLDFESYTSSATDGNYKLEANMFFYGDFNKTIDASLEAIVSPNNLEEHYRANPICGEPVIRVKNNGSAAITSMKIAYGVLGQTLATYNWNGSLASLKEQEITLPSIAELNTVTGTSNEFVVIIEEVNNAVDQDRYNDSLSTQFTAAPKWNGGVYRIDFKTSANYGGQNKVICSVKDMEGNILYTKVGDQASTVYGDTLKLANGCYKLELDASTLGVGLKFFNYFVGGYFRMFNMENGARIALPKTDLGSTSLEGNFGNGFTQYFTVQNSNEVSVNDYGAEKFNVLAYPNPAQSELHVDVLGKYTGAGNIKLINVFGQVVYNAATTTAAHTINTATLANGMYTLIFTMDNVKKIEKVVIAR